MPTHRAHQFVAHIATDLAAIPATRAVLHSGLRESAKHRTVMHPFVSPWISDPEGAANNHPDAERTFATVAGLIAANPDGVGGRAALDAATSGPTCPEYPRPDLGGSLAEAARGGDLTRSLTEKYVRLLVQQPLSGLCPSAVTTVLALRSNDIEVDFARLLDDMLAWPWHRREIATRWTQNYYRHTACWPAA